MLCISSDVGHVTFKVKDTVLPKGVRACLDGFNASLVLRQLLVEGIVPKHAISFEITFPRLVVQPKRCKPGFIV